MLLTNVAKATGNHDRLVVTADFFAGGSGHFFFKGPEVTRQVGASEFVIECRTTNRPFNHDVER